jgi:hypothetical protein
VLDALVERLIRCVPEEALVYARQRLAIDPLSDVAHATAVKLLARFGANAEAQAQVETCRRILERELGGRRSPALELARMEIGKIAPSGDGAGRVAPAPALVPSPSELPSRPMGLGGSSGAWPSGPPSTPSWVARREGRRAEVILLSGSPASASRASSGSSDALVQSRRQASHGPCLRGRVGAAVRDLGDMLREPALPVSTRVLRPARAALSRARSDVRRRASPRPLLFDGVAKLLRELAARAPLVSSSTICTGSTRRLLDCCTT